MNKKLTAAQVSYRRKLEKGLKERLRQKHVKKSV